MEMILHSHANKTHFQVKCCALGLILKERVFRSRKWPIRHFKNLKETGRVNIAKTSGTVTRDSEKIGQ